MQQDMFSEFFSKEDLPSKVAHYQKYVEFLLNVQNGLSMYAMSLADFGESSDSTECLDVMETIDGMFVMTNHKVRHMCGEYADYASKKE